MIKIIRLTKFKTTAVLIAVVFLLFLGIYLLIIKNSTKQPVFSLELPDVYSEVVKIGAGNASLFLRPLEAAAAVSEDAGKARFYRDGYEETDIRQTVGNYSLKEDVILKNPGHPEQFSYVLDTEGLEWEKDEQGNFVFYKTLSGEAEEKVAVLRIRAPYLIDAEGKTSSFRDVEAGISGNILTVRPSAKWLSAHPYPIILDPTIELVILDVHSHPLEGDDWIVSFTTAGQADLTIMPNDQATIVDDEFVSLWCGDQQRFPEIRSGDIIYYPDWECVETGRVIHNTLTAGDHTLKFEFGSEIEYAFNNYSANRKYAWSENTGWINASSTDEQVVVASDGLTGYAWGENIGWIKFDYDGTPGATNTTATDWGVTNDGYGHFGGYAWGENIGWVNFNSTHSEVTIDYGTGEFAGYAWAENIGWINFGHSQSNYTMVYNLPPLVTTQAVSGVGSKTVTANGHAYAGGLVITERGFKYGLTETDTWTVSESGSFSTGNFLAVLENLEVDTTYYIRAYAINSEGTAYGEYVEFTTEDSQKGSPVIFNSRMILKGEVIVK